LRGAELTNVVAIVSRWFGGTKLGKGGLARAYAASVREALRGLQVAEITPITILDLELPLSRVGDLRRILHPPEIEILEETYDSTAHFAVQVARDRVEAVEEALRSRQIFPVRRSE
jgi:putative IMPACT (imprinted ancient) family translation regulator